MDYSYQIPHIKRLWAALKRFGSALDASDTGTGKTACALLLCKALGIVPFVVGPKSARAGWEDLGKLLGVELQYVNYEKLRGRRKLRGGFEVDLFSVEMRYDTDGNEVWMLSCYRNKKLVHRVKGDYQTATEDLPVCVLAHIPMFQAGEWSPPEPLVICQHNTTETEWLEEIPHGKGSYLKWKNALEFVIFDEAHRCGSPRATLQSKSLIAARRQHKYVLCLSATAADDPRQMKALGYALGLHGLSKKTPIDYMSWLLRHGCTPGVFGGFDFTEDKEKKDKAFAKLHNEIFPLHGSRMRKKDIPGFPETRFDVKLLNDDTGRAAALCEELHELNQDEKHRILERAVHVRMGLEELMVPHLVDLAEDYSQTSKVVIFLNYTKPLFRCFEALKKVFGNSRVGYISGQQIGKQGDAERRRFIELLQANKLDAMVVNTGAASESWNGHDPTGQVERTSLIAPVDSGRRLKQIEGRVHRAGGAFSQQFMCYFKSTRQEEAAERCRQKGFNIDLFNDGDLLI